jgi:hypothetical protein
MQRVRLAHWRGKPQLQGAVAQCHETAPMACFNTFPQPVMVLRSCCFTVLWIFARRITVPIQVQLRRASIQHPRFPHVMVHLHKPVPTLNRVAADQFSWDELDSIQLASTRGFSRKLHSPPLATSVFAQCSCITVKTMMAADPGEYCLRVRVAYVEPSEAAQACLLSSAGSWAFTVHIFMHDDTAAFLALLCGDTARLFFDDCVPDDTVSARKLQMKIDAIRTSSCLRVKIAKNSEFLSRAHFQILQMLIV